MRYILLLLTLLLSSTASASTSNTLNITEEDLSPSTYPYQARFANGTVTDNGDGTVSISGGSSATPGGSDTNVQFNDAGSFGGDGAFQYYKGSNTIVISRDAGQTGEAIRISSDAGVSLAAISHDGSASLVTLNTGQGENELYDMDQNVLTTSAVTFSTVDTGQGANELYDMDQNVLQASAVTFSTLDTGQGANELYDMDQNVLQASSPTFAGLTLSSPLTEANGGTGNSSYTKGDLLVASAGTTLTKLPVGTMGQILSVDAGATTGVKWVNTPVNSGGTPGGETTNVQYNQAGSFAGDTSFNWYQDSNLLSISRDAAQTGPAIIISSDAGASLAAISHDGSASLTRLTLGAGSTSDAPLYLKSGSLLSSPVVGAHEFLTDKTYVTITTGTARKEFTLNDGALTSGRMPYLTTNGRLTDTSALTYSTGVGIGSSNGISAPGAGSLSERFGLSAAAGGSGALAIGNSSSASATSSMAIGNGASVNTANVAIFGGNSNPINEVYFGNATLNGRNSSPQAYSINGVAGSGSDVAGANIEVNGGKGTGTAIGGAFIVKTTSADAASSSTANTLLTRLSIDSNGVAVFSNRVVGKSIVTIQTADAATVLWDPTPDADKTATGIKVNNIVAGETIAVGELVYLKSDGKWWKTDADAASTSGGVMLGFALEAKAADQAMTVAMKGSFVRNDTWAWTTGQTIYISVDAGVVTYDQPTGTDDVIRVVGFAVNGDVVNFDPSSDYITHT